MSKKKRQPAHANHERWLVSYADFITLMFAFFVVMFSSSQVDRRRVGRLALAMQVAFQKFGIFESSNVKLPLSTSQPMPFSDTQMIENANLKEALGRLASSPQGPPASIAGISDLRQLRREIESALGPQIRLNEVAIQVRRDGLVLSLREVGFFASGSPFLKKEAEPAIDRLVAVLLRRPYSLRIEGHTDNIPIHSASFASNWELSTARATNMIDVFITHYGFDPARLSAGGYAEFHPVASNSTAEGRSLNRRVDIVILPPDANLWSARTVTSPLRAAPAGIQN